MTGLPKFRQQVHNSGYIEGWALYAEELGKEVGFYQDPVSDYGGWRVSCFARCASSSTPAFTPRAGRAIRWSTSFASPAP